MKYKSRQEYKYLLFFIFHMLFQNFQRYMSIDSPYRNIFKIENIFALVLLAVGIIYEIYARRKFDESCGNSYKLLTRDEMGCVVIILLAVIFFIWNPFHQ